MPIETIIVALGNPEKIHLHNRHNIGFCLADKIFADYRKSEWQAKFRALIATIEVKDTQMLLVKPQTYMNLSGESVQKVIKFYKLPIESLWVLHDELDLPFGKIQLKFGGGTAGHNGLKNISEHLNKEFHRLRFGIGRPTNRTDISDYVLSDFAQSERQEVETLSQKISDNIDCIIRDKLLWN